MDLAPGSGISRIPTRGPLRPSRPSDITPVKTGSATRLVVASSYPRTHCCPKQIEAENERAKGLDPEVLLDGFEEQLDLPALAVDLGDGGSGQIEAIREKT
jgi:hypothetical protein